MMGQDDWTLMQQVARGDEAAVEELYDRFATLVFKVARQLLPSKSEAEDSVQEIFIRLWQTADRYDPRRAKLVTWVMLIARRHLIDQLRRQSIRPAIGGYEDDWSNTPATDQPTSQPETAEHNERLMKRLEDLPELQRTVIERTYLQGYTLREVSEQLEAPLGTIKSALSRGLGRLRDNASSDWVG